ncbi:unnamed protein product [marine sediment metagenome]|uniref:Uncharacterized protein n=1 Tax=marine sediment metagenome TaxID=412755 RepID=X1F5G0_9ZZZZ
MSLGSLTEDPRVGELRESSNKKFLNHTAAGNHSESECECEVKVNRGTSEPPANQLLTLAAEWGKVSPS